MSFQMYVPTKILFGAGQLDQLEKQVMPGKKALIVISGGKSAKNGGYLERTERLLRKSGVETAVFDKIQANPLASTIMDGSSFARTQGCDFIVALDVGSVMDASKAIAGTGSEVDQWGVVSNDKTKEKIGFGGIDELYPVLAIVDPELMKTVPAPFTAYQGLRGYSA